MSSYLNVYIKIKNSEDKILLYSFSSSTDIYQLFWENNLYVSAYAEFDNTRKRRFYELSYQDLERVVLELKDEIVKDTKKLHLTEKYTKDVEEIMNWQEYIDDKIELLHDVGMIQLLIAEYRSNSVEKLYTNID